MEWLVLFNDKKFCVLKDYERVTRLVKACIDKVDKIRVEKVR